MRAGRERIASKGSRSWRRSGEARLGFGLATSRLGRHQVDDYGMDEAAVLAECERGEDVAKKTYEEALGKDLPADVRSMVERQYQGVRQHHDRVRQIRGAVS